MKKTIAQELGIKEFPFEIKDKSNNVIYKEWEDGYWTKCEYNSQGQQIYYDNKDNLWEKREYNDRGVETYFENSYGQIIDNRPKPSPEPKPEPQPEPTTHITLQHCLDRGFTVEKVHDPIYKEKHGKDYKICYLKVSKRHMIDYCNATYRCMVYKVDSEGTILERKYLKDVGDLDFYISFLGSEKVLRKLSKLG
jgi:hypothetical protein